MFVVLGERCTPQTLITEASAAAAEEFVERIDRLYVKLAESILQRNLDLSVCVDADLRVVEDKLVLRVRGVQSKGAPIYPLVVAHELLLGKMVFRE